MNASIVTVGTEILVGSILNTHAKFISEKLNDLGVHVNYHISVRDDMEQLKKNITDQISLSDIVIICGGLGPTADDLTKEALSESINKKIILDEFQHEKLLKRFKESNRPMTENNLKQAMVIEDAIILDNMWGIAPGEFIEYNDKKIFLFPGPPKELEPMVEEYLADYIHDENEIVIRSLNVASLGESVVEDRLRKLNLETSNITLNTFARFYDTEIKIIAEGTNREVLENEVQIVVQKLYVEFGSLLYSEGDVPLNMVLVNKLIEKNIKISFAESITGGLLARNLITVPSASKVIQESYVTYSNSVKNKVLGVKTTTLNEFGAVSKETALEMAKGLKNITKADVCVSTTGEAGPVPSEKDKGLCYVCYYFDENNYSVEEYHFRGNRMEIQQRLADTAILNLILKLGR